MENIEICFIFIHSTNAGIDLMTLCVSYDVTTLHYEIQIFEYI